MIAGDPRSRLKEVQALLSPKDLRTRTISALDELFRGGSAPDPPPDGFLRGRALTGTIWAPLDALGRRLAIVYMPWLGKSFDSSAGRGVNVLERSALAPMRLMWPNYNAWRRDDGRIEAFRFKTRTAPGSIDSGTTVLKIDYDFEENPTMIIRRVLDEVVQIEAGLYLGKVLYRLRSGFHPIGFFSLEK
jgi:hypothetical protein